MAINAIEWCAKPNREVLARFVLTAVLTAGLAAVLMAAPAMAQQASQAQQNAIRQACPADYQAHCPNTTGRAAFLCLQQNMSSLSPACRQAVSAVGGASSRGAAPSSGAAAGAAPQQSPGPASPQYSQPGSAQTQYAEPLSPRQELMLLRQSCGGDFRALCSGVPLGGGRVIACLRANAASLSPQCGRALSAARGTR